MDGLEKEELEPVSIKQLALKWGFISGVVSIAFFMIIVMADLVGNSAVSWLGYIPFIIILFLANKEFKDSGDGYMSYSQGLGLGTLVAFVSSIVSGVFTYVYTKFIVTDFYVQMQDKMIEIWEQEGLSEEQIDAALAMVSKFQSPEIILGIGIVTAVFFGFLLSLIISAITKNPNPELDI